MGMDSMPSSLKGKGHIDAVLPSFSHADDAAGANTETRALGGLDGADAVIEGMARADMREKAAAGFNVMMVACDAGRKRRRSWSSLKMPWDAQRSIVRSFHGLVDGKRFIEILSREGRGRS